jgi:hypothetical protein
MIGQATPNTFHPDSFRKEQVIRRLRSRAIQYWGLQEADADKLDPLVDMLLGACSVEFERTAQEVHVSQSRLLERLAQLMVPEVYTNARPAHAIMHARADGAILKLKPEDQFFVEKEVQEDNKISTLPITFSPVSNCQVYDAAVVCQAVGNKITFYESPLAKGKSLYGEPKESLAPYTLWLGLRLNTKIASLKGMRLFFDWKNDLDRKKYLSLLSAARWSVNETALKIAPGFAKQSGDRLQDFDAMAELEGHVLQYYQQHFITVEEGEHVLSYQKYPAEFAPVFSPDQLKEIKEELVWLKISFPGLASQQPLHEVYCTLNCFPVMNRKLHQNSRPYTLTPSLNIIPIQSKEHYLSIRRVYTDNRAYRSLSFREVGEAEDGTYSVRQGGVARFDQRNAASLLNYLWDLLRDESAAFSAFGHHALTTEIRSLEQGLTRLQMHFLQKLQEQSSKCHLLLHTKTPEDVWVEFWSTQGATANQLPSGKKANPQTQTFVKREDLMLITATAGGKEAMNETEKLQVYKHTLLTRNRIVTEEDIKSACFAELGEKLERVTVKKGFVVDASAKKGFSATLDVVLTPAPNFAEINWKGACYEMQALLERKKMFTTKIQVYTQTESAANVPG